MSPGKREFFIHGATYRADGNADSMFSRAVEWKDAPMAHHVRGLTFTATGYGSRIPTRYMVKFDDKWRRIFSNSGTLYIGKLPAVGERLIVRDYAGAV